MSLIPYSHRDESQSVVLRHNQTLVLFDPQSQQLALREVQPPAATALELVNCPACHRPLYEDDGHGSGGESLEGDGDTSDFSDLEGAEPRYVDPLYFRMLQASIIPPQTPTLPSSLPATPSSPPELRSRMQHARVEEAEESPSSSFIASDEPSPRAERISKSAFSPNYFKRFFKVERELGRGGSGVVLLVKHVLDGVSLGHFACKRVPVGNDHAWLEKVLTEVQLLQQLTHQNLVSYRHVWLEDMELGEFQPSVPCAFILQQYCNSGDLHSYVLGQKTKPTKELLKERMRRKSRGQPDLPSFLSPARRLSFDEILSFFRDIASGLNHLHKNGYIHRDLKPSNCLMNDTGMPGKYPRVLLSDFGEVQKENSKRKSTGATGTISYCAPEVLRRVGPSGEYSNFTAKSDVFALGLILYFMCFNKLPYAAADEENEENEDIDELRAEISAWRGLGGDNIHNKRTDLPDQLYKSLNTLLSPNPDVRPSAEEILRQLENFGPEFADDSVPRSSKFRGPTSIPRDARSLNNAPVLNAPRSTGGEEDVLGFRRISPIADTPPTSNTPVNGRTKSTLSMMNLAARHSRLRSSANASSSSSLDRSLERPSPSSHSSIPMDRSQSVDSTIVVRRRGSSAVTLSPPSTAVMSPERRERSGSPVKMRSPRLMPPVSLNSGAEMGLGLGAVGGRGRWFVRTVTRPGVVMGLKTAVFLLKAFSVYKPCSPLAPNPYIHLLILGIAVFDFHGWYYSRSVLLLVIHFALLLISGWTGQLCPY